MNKKLCLLLFLLFSFEAFSQNTIKIDGFFDDWNNNQYTYLDDTLDSQGVDLLSFSVCDDDNNLYIRIKLSHEIDLTEQFYNPAKIYINIDADNNPSTGFFTNGIGS